MSEEALKQEEVIEEEGEVIDLEESKPEEPAIVETPTEDGGPEVVTEEPEPEKVRRSYKIILIKFKKE